MSRVSFGKTNFDGGRYIRIDDATTTYDGDVKSSFKIKRDDVIRVVWSQKYSRSNCHSSYYFFTSFCHNDPIHWCNRLWYGCKVNMIITAFL